ncbi:MAG TPA: hypothetical protein VNQ81_13985 [Povalibacter sp.]|nr:hypothetical protein [Povalibacter sp.]
MESELYGLSALLLADITGVHIETAKRWKRAGQLPAAHRAIVQLKTVGDLGMLNPHWRGYRLYADRIWTPEGAWVSPGDIRAIPYTRELVKELKRQLAEPQQWNLF